MADQGFSRPGAAGGTAAPARVITLWVWPLAEAEADGWRRRAQAVMSAEERARAARFHRAADRDSYAAARLMLREVLARATGTAPAALGFATGARGKPALAAGQGSGQGPGFNLSHVTGLVVLGLASRHDIGVDVAHLGAVPEELAETICSAEERRALTSLEPAARPAQLARLWVLKEALAKACGLGIAALPPGECSFDLARGEVRLVAAPCGPGWACRLVAPCPGAVAALVLGGTGAFSVRIKRYYPFINSG